MGKPLALRHCHIGEDCLEGGILRAASIDAETDLAAAMPHMANPHLREMLPIGGTLDAIVILPTTEAIPHRLDGSVNGGIPFSLHKSQHPSPVRQGRSLLECRISDAQRCA